ncbi:MAG: DUF2306 domain-containing protein [Gemmatimonadaceae bacterium]|nr:DUF2306 domain-containing protein [Gemmatimonadaceae bacterium]
MSATRIARDWAPLAGLLALGVVPTIAGIVRLHDIAALSETAATARFHAAPVPIVLHVIGSLVFALAGALQFAPRLRRRPGLHRRLGRVALPAGVLSVMSGLWMTLTYPWPPGDGHALFAIRLVVGAVMLVQLLLGVAAIRRRDFALHGRWMTRAYALGMGAGTQVLTHLPVALMGITPGVTLRAVLMATGWGINAIVAESLIRARAGPSRSGARSLPVSRARRPVRA